MSLLNVVPAPVVSIARALQDAGGEVHLVGGAVRDHLIGCTSKDMDVVVGRMNADEMLSVLSSFGIVNTVGKSFGTAKLKIDGLELDFALRRTESKSGRGHKGFLVATDPDIPLEADLQRRDYTINAIAICLQSGMMVDPFGGKEDMSKGRLQHCSDAFSEDPLRVLRGMQFCSRFGLTASDETIALCRTLKSEYGLLSKERIWAEWEKWTTKSTKPSAGLTFLLRSTWIDFYPELVALIGTPQREDHHPEGDVWTHTLQVVDAIRMVCAQDSIEDEDRTVLMLAALCHDLGKPATTQFIDGAWKSYSHDEAGVDIAETFLKRIGAPQRYIDRIVKLVRYHIDSFNAETPKAVRKLANRLAPATVLEMSRLMTADVCGRAADGNVAIMEIPEAKALLDAATAENVTGQKTAPLVQGRDLIKQGIAPGPEMGRLLKLAYDAQIEGAFSTTEDGLLFLESLK